MVQNRVFKTCSWSWIKQNMLIKQNLMSEIMLEKNWRMFLIPKKIFRFIALMVFKCKKDAFTHFFDLTVTYMPWTWKEHFQMIYAHSVDRRNHNALHLPDMYSDMYRGQRLVFREQLWDYPKELTDRLPCKEQTGAETFRRQRKMFAWSLIY